MSGPRPGFLATYNSLTDKHLAEYFSNARIRRHLQRSGLISRSGRIIPEKEYRLNAMRRDHERYVQECLTQAIFLKVLDMECQHQLKARRKLENSVRKERVQKTKMERSRRSVEDANPVHSPHPPLGPRSHYGRHPLVAGELPACSQLVSFTKYFICCNISTHEQKCAHTPRAPGPVGGYSGGHPSHQHGSKESAFIKATSSQRPKTAPGNMHYPFRLQPLHSCAAVGTVPKSSGSKQKCHTLENYQQFATGQERSGLRLMNSMESTTGKSPYRLPVINNYLIPVPPPTLQKGDRSGKAVRNEMPRRRRFHPITAPNGLEQLSTKNSGEVPKPSLRSNAYVTMIFLGKSVHLSHDDSDYRDEIKVYQQHCGGENLCVYKGKLLEGETFQFISRRHRGFPFSLTFFLNGMQVDRLSSCCEYRHQKHSRLGGRHGYFGFLNVEGASPCYRCGDKCTLFMRCIIAMDLDKKPSPPKRETEENCEEKQVSSWKDGVHGEPSGSSVDQKPSKETVLVILPRHEADVETIEDKMETTQDYGREEGTKLSNCETEDIQEDTGKNEYNEDFEADEEVNEEGQTGDQRNGMSKSSPDDEKQNLDYEKESKNTSQKVLQASDSEKDESDGHSDSTSENGKQEKSSAGSLSSTSTQDSSEDDSDAEKMNEDVKGKEEYDTKEASHSTAHAQCGNENGEDKLFRTEDSQETFSLEEEGTDEAGKTKAETPTSRENTEAFHESIMAIQHRGPDVTGEVEQATSVENNITAEEEKNVSNRWDSGEENVPVPLENNMMEVEDRNEESPQSDKGGVSADGIPAQEEITEATGNDHPVTSEPECSDLWVEEEVENATSAECDPSEAAAGGAVLADRTGAPGTQFHAVVEVAHVGQDREGDEDHAAEQGHVGTDCSGHGVVWAGEPQPEEEAADQVPMGHLLVDGSTPTRGAMAEGDAEEKEPGKGMEPGAESKDQGAPTGLGENTGLWKNSAGEGEEQVGTGALPTVREARGLTGGEGAVYGASGEQRVMGAAVPVLGEMVPEEQGAVRDADLAEEIAEVCDSAAVWAAEKAAFEGQKSMEDPRSLLEMLGDTEFCIGKEILMPNEFSQLKFSREEQVDMDALETAASEPDRPPEGEGSSQPRAEEVEEPEDSGRGPVLHTAPGPEAGVGAGRDPASGGSSPLEQTATEGDEEGSAIVLLSGNLSLGSTEKSEGAMAEKSAGVVMGLSGDRARDEPGTGEVGGAAEPREQVAMGQGMLECGAGGEQGPELCLGESTLWKEAETASEGAVGASGAQEQRTGSPERGSTATER
ncbi:UNVERIFIED_CONTAM: hypothetical protein H355_009073 [Colinus virginianus]|nr:hypothetical protein H355_009073 [Colinus virginianus]